MAGSTFGERLKMTTFGESHGEAVGVILEGVTPGVELDEAYIQIQMDRRRPGQSSVTTPARNTIRSALYPGYSRENHGHATVHHAEQHRHAAVGIRHHQIGLSAGMRISHMRKIRDSRLSRKRKSFGKGDGRASGAGAVARKLLERRGVSILAYTTEIGGIRCEQFDADAIERNAVRACDPEATVRMIERIERLAEEGTGAGIVECRISGIAAGLGNPYSTSLTLS